MELFKSYLPAIITLISIGIFSGCITNDEDTSKIEIQVKDTTVIDFDTNFFVYPIKIFSNDSIITYFGEVNHKFAFFNRKTNKLIETDDLSYYIDDLKEPTMGRTICLALTTDSIYCLRYNKLYLLNRSEKTYKKKILNFNFDSIGYYPTTSFQNSVIDRKSKKIYVTVQPFLSFRDKNYLNYPNLIQIDLNNFTTKLINFTTPPEYKRGKVYNQVWTPSISISSGTVFCSYPISNIIRFKKRNNDSIFTIQISPSHSKLDSDLNPDPEVALREYVYYKTLSRIDKIYSFENMLYIVYKKRTELQEPMLTGKSFLLGYDFLKREQIFDIKVHFHNDISQIYDIKSNIIYVLQRDKNSENKFIQTRYEIINSGF